MGKEKLLPTGVKRIAVPIHVPDSEHKLKNSHEPLGGFKMKVASKIAENGARTYNFVALELGWWRLRSQSKIVTFRAH